jgi:predicted Zn finger-like uncharacterized protein
MIIVCPNCSSRIQIDDAKIPTGSFSVRCPKCSHTVNSSGASLAPQKSALSVGGSPSTESHRFDRIKPAPLFETQPAGPFAEAGPASTLELARALRELLGQKIGSDEQSGRERPVWQRRRVLVCLPEARRDAVARRLDENGYQVFVAGDTRQAVERMRDHQLEVVLLDPEFDSTEQGAAFVTREVNILRPAQRRRLFFGLLSPSLRTLDAHAAFLNNANLTINLSDLEDLPAVLDRAIRDYNELYYDFFRALNASAL